MAIRANEPELLEHTNPVHGIKEMVLTQNHYVNVHAVKYLACIRKPTRMQSDNAPNLTAEVSKDFMKASQVTKVTSNAGQPRTLGLVEQQNCTLPVPLVCSHRMRYWDQLLDEVMEAFNLTRHAKIGLLLYMRTRGTEKAILTNIYPEIAARSFETHELYRDHVLVKKQGIHYLCRTNTTSATTAETQVGPCN